MALSLSVTGAGLTFTLTSQLTGKSVVFGGGFLGESVAFQDGTHLYAGVAGTGGGAASGVATAFGGDIASLQASAAKALTGPIATMSGGGDDVANTFAAPGAPGAIAFPIAKGAAADGVTVLLDGKALSSVDLIGGKAALDGLMSKPAGAVATYGDVGDTAGQTVSAPVPTGTAFPIAKGADGGGFSVLLDGKALSMTDLIGGKATLDALLSKPAGAVATYGDASDAVAQTFSAPGSSGAPTGTAFEIAKGAGAGHLGVTLDGSQVDLVGALDFTDPIVLVGYSLSSAYNTNVI